MVLYLGSAVVGLRDAKEPNRLTQQPILGVSMDLAVLELADGLGRPADDE